MTLKPNISKFFKRISLHLKQRAVEKKHLLSFIQQFNAENPQHPISKHRMPYSTKNTTDAIIWIKNKKIGIELSQYNGDAIRKGQKIKSRNTVFSEKIGLLKEQLTEYLLKKEFIKKFKGKYPNESICCIGIDFTDYGVKRLNSLPNNPEKSNSEYSNLVLEVSNDINNYIFQAHPELKLININYFSPKEKDTYYSDLLKESAYKMGIPIEEEAPSTANAKIFLDLNFSYLSGGWYALTSTPIINQIEQKKIKHRSNYSRGQFDEVWLVLHTGKSRVNEIIGNKDTIVQCRLQGIQKDLSHLDHPFQRIFLLSLGQDGFMLSLVL